MNILLSTYSYYPYNWGGTEVYVSGLAAYLKKQGHHVMVIAGMPPEAFTDYSVFYEDDQLKTVLYADKNIDVIGVVLKNAQLAEIYSKYRAEWERSWRNIWKGFENIEWDILHVHGITSAIGEPLIKAVKDHSPNVKIFASYHLPVSCAKGTLMYANCLNECNVKPGINACTACIISEKTQLPIWLAKPMASLMPLLDAERIAAKYGIKSLVKIFLNSWGRIDQLIDQWHVFSKKIEHVMQDAGITASKINLIRHGVNPLFIATEVEKKERETNNKSFIFLYASRFEKTKGFITLLDAWLSMPLSEERILYMVGDSQTGSKVEESWINKSLERSDILWLGRKSNDELALIMKRAHCIIIPSQCLEIGPLVYHEAIAAGANIIASDIGGCKELAGIYPEVSSLFKTGNPEQLKERIINFIYHRVKYKPLLQDENYANVCMSYNSLFNKVSI